MFDGPQCQFLKGALFYLTTLNPVGGGRVKVQEGQRAAMSPTSLLAPAIKMRDKLRSESVASIAYVLELHFIAQTVKYSYAAELAGKLGTLCASCHLLRRCGEWSRSLTMMIEGVGPLFCCSLVLNE